jgi:hypothetical protein
MDVVSFVVVDGCRIGELFPGLLNSGLSYRVPDDVNRQQRNDVEEVKTLIYVVIMRSFYK